MKKLLAIGEALIDMIPSNTGRIMDVEGFQPKVGGAPLNVCGAYTALGGESAMITIFGICSPGRTCKSRVFILSEYGCGYAFIREGYRGKLV